MKITVYCLVLFFLLSCTTSNKVETTAADKIEPSMPKNVPITYIEAPYRKLCSKSFINDYRDKGVSFKAMFIGEWTTLGGLYETMVNIKDRVFINHRDISYISTQTGPITSDMGYPEFGQCRRFFRHRLKNLISLISASLFRGLRMSVCLQ